MKLEKTQSKKDLWSLGMTLVVFAVIECDAVASIISNQILSMGMTPVIWGIGAAVILVKVKKNNAESLLYNNSPFSHTDGLIFFFIITCGIAIAINNFLYAGLKPLFIRELFTGYPLYTVRNIIYYPLEVLLMLELLICAQRAGEVLTKKTLPWGALALFALWGLPHILWHGVLDGIVSAFRAFIYSIPFYASNKNIKTGYIGMLILWFL